MTVSVRLFAGCASGRAGRSGRSRRRRSPTSGATLGLGDEPAGLLYAVNQRYAPRETVLAEGDEVAVIPPVSGGAFLLSDEPLSLERVVEEVRDERAGAIATFTGTTRLTSRGRTVLHLDYEAYEGMAESVMAEIGEELRRRYDLCAVAIHHRTGPRRDRRDVGGDRRVGAAPRRRAGRVPGRHRRPQGARPALEEGVLRGRRGVDRTRLVTAARYNVA